MPSTEELRIYLRTIADTAGITKTEASLKGIQQQTASMGRSSGTSLLAFGAAAGVAGVSVDRFAGVLADSIDAARDHERIMRATTASYGAQTAQWQKFSSQLSATTGFTSDAILEAALSARTLSTNYGLSIDQTQKLIRASADLARIRGIGVAESFERVQSAIRGEAEASEYLGLTLNDTFLTNQAMNGSLKTTFGTMTDVEKAQIRYNELLKQSADFAGLAASNTDSLDGAFNRAGTSAHNLQVELGEMTKPAVLLGLQVIADTLDMIRGGGLVGKAAREIQEGLAKPAVGGGGGSGGFLPGAAGPVDPYLDPKVKAAYVKEQAQREAAARRLRELNELPPLDNAATLARLAYLDQVDAAVREVKDSQQEQLDLQRQSVDLAAQEAGIRLSMLPAAERLAAAQRDVAEAQIRARQAALPASEALEDLRYEQQRAQLIIQNRDLGVDARVAARRQLRDLARAAPGAELAALEAGRGVTTAGRAAERVGLQRELFGITAERALAQVQALEQSNKWLQQIAEQKGQAILLTINMTGEAFSQEVFKQLIEANNQAQMPTTIPQSGVRRG